MLNPRILCFRICRIGQLILIPNLNSLNHIHAMKVQNNDRSVWESSLTVTRVGRIFNYVFYKLFWSRPSAISIEKFPINLVLWIFTAN